MHRSRIAQTPTANGAGRIYIDDITVSNKPSTSTFGIYLAETGDLLLSDEDMAAYVRATHKIELNASGIKKWNSYIAYNNSYDPPIPTLSGGLYQKEFAVRIDDTEYYRGKFWSIVSSASCSGVVILDVAMPLRQHPQQHSDPERLSGSHGQQQRRSAEQRGNLRLLRQAGQAQMISVSRYGRRAGAASRACLSSSGVSGTIWPSENRTLHLPL